MKRTLPVLALLLVSVAVGACGGGAATSEGDGGVRVVASTTHVGDFVGNVGGDAVDVHQILQPGSDPHDYEPRPADVQETAGAEIVFANGLGLDPWVEEVVSESGGEAAVVELGDAVPNKRPGEEGHEEEHGAEEHGAEEAHAEEGHEDEGGFDPHWFHDPRNVEAAVREIRDRLSEADPDNRQVYERNAEEYLARLGRLDEDISACIERVPEGERKLVTDHDSFGYFTERYGITVVGAVIPSQTTQAQPSAGDTAELIRLIEAEDVRAVFSANTVNPRVAEAIARETGASTDYALYGDALGSRGSDGDTYLKAQAHNADAMVRGFTGGEQGCEIETG